MANEGASAYAYNDAVRRIRELQELNALLTEQIDRMRPIVYSAMRSADYYASRPNNLTGYEIDLRD